MASYNHDNSIKNNIPESLFTLKFNIVEGGKTGIFGFKTPLNLLKDKSIITQFVCNCNAFGMLPVSYKTFTEKNAITWILDKMLANL